MVTLPWVEEREPAGCVLEVGTPPIELVVAPFYPLLREVKVDVARDKAAEATLVFESRRGPAGTWDVEDSGLFRDWTPLRVLAAFGSTRREEILSGAVREVKVEHPENAGESTVTVTVQDLSLMADREHRREVWGGDTPSSDSLIVNQILARNRLRPHEANGTGLSQVEVNQDGTDAALLRSRAEDNGYDLLYEGRTVYFGPPRMSGPDQAPILVAAGTATNCLSFDVTTDGRRPDTVVIEYADGRSGSPATERVQSDLPTLGVVPVRSEVLGDHTLVMKGQAGDDRQALRRKAQAKANELALKVKAEGELDGTMYGSVLRTGRTVQVDGVGPTFSGRYFVDSVAHRLTPDGYRQRFVLLRNAYGDAEGATLPGAADLASLLSS